jgi:hypothetical protein
VRKALIAGAFTIIAALIAAFSDDIRSRLGGPGDDPLLGSWGCRWSVTEGEHHPGSDVSDTLTFESVSDAKVSGYGEEAQFGRYPFHGMNSAFAVSIAYSGVKTHRNFVGVALLRKGNFANSLSGVWTQYVDEGELSGGEVVCSKHEK